MRISRKKAWWLLAATVLGTAVVVLFSFNFMRSEKTIERSIEHDYAVNEPQFRREMGVLLGPGITSGNRVEALDNGVEIFPAMLEAIRGAERTINFETYIYWSGDIGREFSEALSERARAGVKVNVVIDWVGGMKMDADVADAHEGRRRARAVLPAAGLVQPLAHQQAHAPQAADRGRAHRLHRRRRHRRPVDRHGAGPGALARHALPRGRPGGGADPGRLHRQLDQDHGPRAQRRGILPAARPRGRHGRAPVHQLARRRQRKHAPDVPDGHRRHARDAGRARLLLRARRTHRGGAAHGAQARRACARAGAGRAHRFGAGEGVVARPVGRPAAGRRADPRLPADDDAREVADRRRPAWCRWARPTSTCAASSSTTRPA